MTFASNDSCTNALCVVHNLTVCFQIVMYYVRNEYMTIWCHSLKSIQQSNQDSQAIYRDRQYQYILCSGRGKVYRFLHRKCFCVKINGFDLVRIAEGKVNFNLLSVAVFGAFIWFVADSISVEVVKFLLRHICNKFPKFYRFFLLQHRTRANSFILAFDLILCEGEFLK